MSARRHRVVALLCSAACDDTLFGEEPSPYSCERDPPLTYDNFGAPFLEENCTGCHSSYYPEELRTGAPLGVDFDTWTGVLEDADGVRERTVVDLDMPPSGGITTDELARFDEWMWCDVLPAARSTGASGP